MLHPSISIVVPVLDEAQLIGPLLASLRRIAPEAEIIVVDGGSVDGTWSLAQSADVVLRAARGRALQMNAGAAVANGDVLWFLHADLEVPSTAVNQIEHALADARVAGGCFGLRFPRREWIYRVSDSLGNMGVHLFGFALGDHGIFCRRTEFERVGRYPEVPILEDAELYRRLGKAGRMIQLRDEIVSSPRAYERYGPYRTTLVYFMILALYVLGVPIRWLNQVIYCRFRNPSTTAPIATDLARATH